MLKGCLKENNEKIKEEIILFSGVKISMILTFYSLSAFLQRQHLFVWSVFAPKLIYQLTHFIVEFLLIIFLNFLM